MRYTDTAGDIFVVGWIVTGLNAEGAALGTWTLDGGTGKYDGGTGGGGFEGVNDAEGRPASDTITGSIDLP